uniref:Globin family profile domain-containing protein n=1 Tax=Meloidogyne floridensis TaxID=298350 RepID=A0A915PFV4_9BILA
MMNILFNDEYFNLLTTKSQSTKTTKNIRIDCSASSGGLFAGLLFLIASFVSIGIHSFFSQHEDPDGALLVFRLSDMALFCCTLIDSTCHIYSNHYPGMNSLQYQPHEEQQRSTNTEFLDEILLAIGLVGELIHSSTGVMCWISTQSDKAPIKMEVLRALSPKTRREKPGKQFVTFLLISNVSLFFFHTLEGMKSVFGDTIATRRARPYAKLIATQSSGTKLSLADRRYKVNSPRADSLLVQQRHSGRKLGGVAVEPRDNPQCSSTTNESFQLNDDSQQAIIFDMETLEAGDKNRRRKSGSNGSTNSNDTLNRQNQNLQMSRIENSASVLTILLTRTQRVLIENSWKRAKKGAADGGVGRLKYEGQFRRHASVLTRALEYIVKNVQYTDKLGIHFQALGKKHCQMNGGRAFPTHYWDTFLECIIQSLLECDGTSGGRKHRCRETAMAWRNLISFIVQQMRRGFEDERLLRKRFSASLMGIRGIKSNCIKSSGNSSERRRPLVSKINHNVLHQSFGSLDDYSFPFSSNNFNDNPYLSSSNNGIPVYKVNGRVRACSSISPLVAETFTKDENISTLNNNKIQNPSSSARSASWCAEVSAEQMQKMKINGGNSSQEEEGLTILNNNSRVSWSVSSIDGVTEIFYTPKTVRNNSSKFEGDEIDQQTIPRPALTAIKLLLDSTATSGDEHLIVDKDSIPTSTQLLYARHSFSNFVTDEKNGEEQRNAAFDVSQKLLGVAQTDVDSTNDKSSPSQIRRLSAL